MENYYLRGTKTSKILLTAIIQLRSCIFSHKKSLLGFDYPERLKFYILTVFLQQITCQIGQFAALSLFQMYMGENILPLHLIE